jgi:1,4-dihydroxy-2-naphthoate octaprenyltransferase
VSTRPSTAKAWLLAARPATLGASLSPVLVGSSLAAADGHFRPFAAAAALLGALFIQVGTNLVNDYEDFQRGADNADRLGPARATQRGWLSPQQVKLGAVVAFAIAALFGLYLLALGGWPIVAIGILSILSGIAYTAGPMPLAYVGLGDVFVLLFFGLVAVCGTFYVHSNTLSTQVVVASIAVGLQATAILVVNNLRDRVGDIRAGKKTLVARFGERAGRAEYIALLVGSYLSVIALVALQQAPIGWLLVLLTLPLAAKETLYVCNTQGAALNPSLGRTARLGLLFGICLSLGGFL